MNERYGLLKPSDYDTDQQKSHRKVVRLFEKLRRKAESPKFDLRSNHEQDDQPDLGKLNRDAVKSLHILPEVSKKDEGFDVH